MKNIHVLPTVKPSKIGQSVFDKSLHFNPIFNYDLEKERVIPQHIYITNSEKIKKGWHFNNAIDVNNLVFIKSEYIEGLKEIFGEKPSHLEKIILTTDQDLINDGVQAIEDDFLEWFVNNPSCEWVETFIDTMGCTLENCDANPCINYKIIIPKEEPKETLEEAAKSYAKIPLHRDIDSEERYFNSDVREYDAFIEGAKWEKERSYSEEEVKEMIMDAINSCTDGVSSHCQDFEEWYEENKKK
jgi:hypothetical protein